MTEREFDDGLDLAFSRPVLPSVVEKHGCFTVLPVRIGNNFKTSHQLIHGFRGEWAEVFTNQIVSERPGTIDYIWGSWDSVGLPEARPERFGFSIWITSFFFCLDDGGDIAGAGFGEFKKNLVEILERLIRNDSEIPRVSPLEKCFISFAETLLECDRERGVQVLYEALVWTKHLNCGDVLQLDTLDKYLEYRIIDIGMIVYYALIRYVMLLDISTADLQSPQHIQFTRHASMSIALANDYWSWRKERDFPKSQPMILNSVSVLMQTKGVSEQAAQEMVKELTIEYEKKTLELGVELYISKPSSHMELYVHAILWLVSGNHIWSSTCPRYNDFGVTNT